VLVVEDEPSLAQLARLYLEREGYRVEAVADGEEALARLHHGYDIVLLDIGLPGPVDGVEVCRRMRSAGDWTPVIFVTARDDEVDRVLGLELGGDDYVTKPYSPRVMVARVRSLARRVERDTAGATARRLSVGRVSLDLDTRRVAVDGVEIALTATEFGLLAHLMRRPGRVYTRSELLDRVWAYPPGDASRTVDVHVAQLRAKLGSACPIRTVRGVGYSAEEP
jgi:DNA-binding response OmpR family regulator